MALKQLIKTGVRRQHEQQRYVPSPHPSPQGVEGDRLLPLPSGERIEVRGTAKSNFHASWNPEGHECLIRNSIPSMKRGSSPLKNFAELYDIEGKDYCNDLHLITGEDTSEIYHYMFFNSAYLSIG